MSEGRFYTVKSNDTLSSIAYRTGVPIVRLARLNGIRDSNHISIGQKLALNKEAVCGVTFQFLDKDHNPIRNLPHVLRYCGKEVQGKTDQTGRVRIVTHSPTDEITVFVERFAGGLKELTTVVSGYRNKLVTLVSPKLKLEATTRPHPDESKLSQTPSISTEASKTQPSTEKEKISNEDDKSTEVLQSAWSWLDDRFGIRTKETETENGKPVVVVTKDKYDLEFLDKYTGEKLTEADYVAAAKELGCEAEVIKAVEMVESSGSGFDTKNRPVILFERHVFSRNTVPKHKFDKSHPAISEKKRYHYEKIKKIKVLEELEQDVYPNVGNMDSNIEFSYQRLMKAYCLDKDAALKACSWGKFQVLGESYSGGFSSVQEMVKAVSRNQTGQLKTFVSFAKQMHMQKMLQDKDWLKIAMRYNGRNQNGYDKKLEEKYDLIVKARSIEGKKS
jgi:LysM repeat protein